MNKPGILLYKCRRCGKVSKNTHVPGVLVVLMHLLYDTPMPNEWYGVPVYKEEICLCDDKNIGVADIIGAEHD